MFEGTYNHMDANIKNIMLIDKEKEIEKQNSKYEIKFALEFQKRILAQKDNPKSGVQLFKEAKMQMGNNYK